MNLFTAVSIDSLLIYENKYYLQVYLDNCAYKIVNKQMTGYLDENFFKIIYYKCYYMCIIYIDIIYVLQ